MRRFHTESADIIETIHSVPRLQDRELELSTISKRIFNNVSALTFAQLVYRAVSLGISIALARYLGVVELGTYSLVMNFIAIFGAFTDLGIANLVIRDMNQQRGRTNELINSYLSILATINFILLCAAILTAFVFDYDARILIAIFLAGIGMLFGGVSSAFYAALAGNEKMKRIALIELLLTLIIAAGMVIVMISGGGLIALTGVAAITGISRLVLLGAPVRKFIPGIHLTMNVSDVVVIMKRGLPFTLHVGIYVIFTKIDVLLLDLLSDEFTLGIYTAATRLTFPLTVLSMMTATAIFPLVSRYVKERREIAHTIVWKAMRWLGLVGIIIALAVTGLSEQIVVILFGAEYSPSGSILAILIWYIPIFYSYQVVSDLLVASNRVWAIVWIGLLCLALNIILNILLIPRYGAFGAAATSIFCEILRGCALICYARISLRFPR